MFTRKKWLSLSPKTRLRKLALILQKAEVELTRNQTADIDTIASLLETETFEKERSEELVRAIRENPQSPDLRRALNSLRHAILKTLNAEPAEWDLLAEDGFRLKRDPGRVLPIAVYLEDIRSPFNVGSIFRTAEAFGVSRILLSPDTPLPTHKKAVRTSRGCHEVVPWNVEKISEIKDVEGVFALETGGTALEKFSFPQRGLVLIGSEELGLSPEALSLADRGLGRVSIPLYGAKRSLNVSAAFAILIWRWHSVLVSS